MRLRLQRSAYTYYHTTSLPMEQPLSILTEVYWLDEEKCQGERDPEQNHGKGYLHTSKFGSPLKKTMKQCLFNGYMS